MLADEAGGGVVALLKGVAGECSITTVGKQDTITE